MVIKENGAVNTMEAVKIIQRKEEQRLRITKVFFPPC